MSRSSIEATFKRHHFLELELDSYQTIIEFVQASKSTCIQTVSKITKTKYESTRMFSVSRNYGMYKQKVVEATE
jgi:hypothetical protein